MPKVLVPIADGSEELEAISIVDILRRAEVDVVIASLSGEMITASRGTKIVPDMSLDEALEQEFDMVVLPGGMPGTDHLDNDYRIHTLLKEMVENKKYVGAVCAAPSVLAHAGLLDGKRATCYPGFLDNISENVASTNAVVERDGQIITSRAAGTAMDFALEIVEALCGTERRKKVEDGLVR
jgi:4-methyl-5(b-hydroxyethyl)-thiazole monophosphate biosynthesis